MVIEQENEISGGWPLGLGNLNLRFREAERPQAALAEPLYLHLPSSSFSSFSSSNLDTESTASFFPDQSVSLGRLIGIRPRGNRGTLCFSSNLHREGTETTSRCRSNSEMQRGKDAESGQSLCVPLLQNVIEKMSRSKSSSRHLSFRS